MLISIVYVVNNAKEDYRDRFRLIHDFMASLSREYEVILVDNTGSKSYRHELREALSDPALNNFHVYSLLRRIDYDAAIWVGMENAIGDYAMALDPNRDLYHCLQQQTEFPDTDADILLIKNTGEPSFNSLIVLLRNLFVRIYYAITGNRIDMATTRQRVVSRKVINYILQTQDPPLVFRYLINSVSLFTIREIQTSKFISGISYPRRSLMRNIVDAYKLLVGSSIFPLRLVNILSIIGAVFSVLYSIYIIFIHLTKEDVEPGWASLSMQLSFFFLLISIVLAAISEYLILVINHLFKDPRYYIDNQFISGRRELYEKLNVKE